MYGVNANMLYECSSTVEKHYIRTSPFSIIFFTYSVRLVLHTGLISVWQGSLVTVKFLSLCFRFWGKWWLVQNTCFSHSEESLLWSLIKHEKISAMFDRNEIDNDVRYKSLIRAPLLLLAEQPSNHHGSSLPPVPPPHRQQPSVTALSQALSSTHHTGQSLHSTRQLTPPTGSQAPVAGQSPAELQTTPPESVPLQDSWVLGSNVPLETR